jgi:hypothetical protein
VQNVKGSVNLQHYRLHEEEDVGVNEPILFKNPVLHPSLLSSFPSRCLTLTPGET